MEYEKDNDKLNQAVKAVQEYFSKNPHTLTSFIDIKSRGSEFFGKELKRIDLQRNNIGSLLKKYFVAINEVRNNKNLLPKECLKKLLIPFIELHRIYFPDYLKYHEFIDEDILIDELNFNDSTTDRDRYDINPAVCGVLEVDYPSIWLSGEYIEQLIMSCKKPQQDIEKLLFQRRAHISSRMSVSETYKLWLPSLTQESMRSNDLLDRILITYTIKRAANGDKDAIEKLYGLFENAAVAITVKMSNRKTWGMTEERKKRFRTHMRDIKQEAKIILRLLISGFSPETILQSLTEDENNYLKIPKWIKNFYVYWLSEKVPREILESHFDSLMTCAVFLNPYTCMVAETEWRGTPKAVRRFNSFVFRPLQGKNTHLYTWLFGLKKEPKKETTKGFMQGRFCQMMSDSLDRYVNLVIESPHDFLDGGEESETKQEFNYRQKIIKDKKSGKRRVDDETIEEAVEKLIGNGISKRDAEIFLKHKLQGFYKTELAQMYALDRRQIYRICKNLSIKYPS